MDARQSPTRSHRRKAVGRVCPRTFCVIVAVAIVHPTNPEVSVDRAFVAQSFLKKVGTWGHGGVIRPVDLGRDSPVRRRFSDDILGRSIAAVRSYWQQMIFSGRGVPPPEVASDEEVLRFVRREPGAIGYVSSGIEVAGVRVLVVR
jgi:hypothetical protein